MRAGLAALARAPALFLTNKENLVLETGHFEGTALNSDRQLWSVAGTLAAMLRVTFGIRLDGDRLRFMPAVPRGDTTTRTITGLRWRQATFDITVRGPGRGVASMFLDGVRQAGDALVDTLRGRHAVTLDLAPWPPEDAPLQTLDPSRDALPTPEAQWSRGRLRWHAVTGAARYAVWRDGRHVGTTTATTWPAPVGDGAHEWQVVAEADDRAPSFAGAPVFPQRGTGAWNDWGVTNVRVVRLSRGTHVLTLEQGPMDRNMNGVVNDARLDAVRVTRLAEREHRGSGTSGR
ncbi:MAG: hypothetical protein MUF53_06640 [Gemmatimonadaceae bacterium]|nr:hypothetical protein [Gemmatimonadaceae bacterium]